MKKKIIKVRIVEDKTTGLPAILINGTRITPRKDTGSWNIVNEYEVTRKDIIDAMKCEDC